MPETQWTKLYLKSWERLSSEGAAQSSVTETQPPDAFVQMPPSQTNVVQRLRYMTDPLPHDVLVAGPIALTLYASIDQDDTNWIVILKDVGPDVSVQSVREGEREVPKNLPEREVTRGWLKASHRAIDPARSKPYWPWHPLTREAQKPVTPGAVEQYQIEIMATANLFRARTPHQSGNHQPRSAHRCRRRHQRRICAVPHLFEQDGGAQNLSRPQPALAPSAAHHPRVRAECVRRRSTDLTTG